MAYREELQSSVDALHGELADSKQLLTSAQESCTSLEQDVSSAQSIVKQLQQEQDKALSSRSVCHVSAATAHLPASATPHKCTLLELLMQSGSCAVQQLVEHVCAVHLPQAFVAQAHALSLNSLFGIKQK